MLSRSLRPDIDLVCACEDLLVLTRHPPGSLIGQAGHLFDRTGGALGALRALLADAATEAILTHAERLTKTLLDATPTDRQADQHAPSTTSVRRSPATRGS